MEKKIEIFDPAMCCPTGVCGPSVDPVLIGLTSDLDWLQTQGVQVFRYGLSQQPQAFVHNAKVKVALEKDPSCLPLTLVSGKVVKEREYPNRRELAGYFGLSVEENSSVSYTLEIAELVAIGASVGSNCLACFKYHHDQATKLGVSLDVIIQTVNTALAVKKTAGDHMTKLVDKTLCGGDTSRNSKGSGCCVSSDSPGSGGSCCG